VSPLLSGNKDPTLLASVVWRAGTKNLVADETRKITAKTYYDIIGWGHCCNYHQRPDNSRRKAACCACVLGGGGQQLAGGLKKDDRFYKRLAFLPRPRSHWKFAGIRQPFIKSVILFSSSSQLLSSTAQYACTTRGFAPTVIRSLMIGCNQCPNRWCRSRFLLWFFWFRPQTKFFWSLALQQRMPTRLVLVARQKRTHARCRRLL